MSITDPTHRTPDHPRARRLRPGWLLAALATALLMAGCGGDISDLERYVERTKQRPGGEIEPIPEIPPQETFIYPGHERDPFDRSVIAVRVTEDVGPESDVTIDPDRPPEFLEQYPLDSLRMVGTMEQDNVQWALIRTPERNIQRVREGNYMGQNHGRIDQITDTRIAITEIVPDGFGGYQERESSVALTE
ncbi:MAG: pilus assembly protein PilP [Chromatiaceae bacterium]|nr:MAG: pilus assembly protein PilP [Chromatiaceae bacterium]